MCLAFPSSILEVADFNVRISFNRSVQEAGNLLG